MEDGSGSTMEVVSGSGKWKYCEVVVDGPNEPPYFHLPLPLTTSIVLPLPSCFHFHRASTSIIAINSTFMSLGLVQVTCVGTAAH